MAPALPVFAGEPAPATACAGASMPVSSHPGTVMPRRGDSSITSACGITLYTAIHACIRPPPAPLQFLDLPWLRQAQVQAATLRLDLIDPLISGNKWFKLRHHLQQAGASHAPGLISLGGNHSNHLHALAAAGKRFGFATVGLLRGHAQDTPTVRDLQALGMELHWLGYGGYRARNEPGFWVSWQARYPGWHCIPEGAAGWPVRRAAR